MCICCMHVVNKVQALFCACLKASMNRSADLLVIMLHSTLQGQGEVMSNLC